MKPFYVKCAIISSLLTIVLMGCQESFSPPYVEEKDSLQNLKAAAQDPIANAGPDQTARDSDGNGVEAVTLDASKSYDPNGEIIGYSWTKDGNIILGVSPVITVDFAVGVHTIILFVTDNEGLTDSDTTIITILEQSALSPPTEVKTVFDEEAEAAQICWKASITANVSYAVYRSSISGGPYQQIATALKETCYLDASVAEMEEDLYYVVTSINENALESGYSNEAILILD